MSQNKRRTKEIVKQLSQSDHEILQEVASMPVARFYLLPTQQVDFYHRIFMRMINANRQAYIDNINASATDTSLDRTDDSEE